MSSESMDLKVKLNRKLQCDVERILGNEELRKWLIDKSNPKTFRGAGYFWSIGPGTPPSAVRARINEIDNTLKTALEEMDKLKVNNIIEQHGKILFERSDIERCIEFQAMLKKRFEKDLRILGYFD